MKEEKKQFYKNMTDEDVDKLLNKIDHVVQVEKKYSGYGYHGGGRPRKDVEARRMTISISGTPSEIEKLKKLAEEAGKNVSRFILDNIDNLK